MTTGAALLLEMLDAIEHDPAVADRLRRALGVPPMAPTTEPTPPLYLRVPAYAQRVSMGERTIWELVSRGLPTIGVARSRRVDVSRADAWLRERRAHVDDAVERQARASARRAAAAGGRVR